MKPNQTSSADSPLPCTWQPESSCQGCQIKGQLMCRLDKKDIVNFFMILFPFGITAIAGVIRAGFGWYLLGWLAYSLFFFFVWEAYVLCRHCPYWAEDSPILHCHANSGVLKIWNYQPGPMSRWERVQFILGALIWIGFPFPFLFLGSEYLLAVIALSSVVSGIFILRQHVCSRCIHFSCPMNAVPSTLVDAYLRQNPNIKEGWQAFGYRMEGNGSKRNGF